MFSFITLIPFLFAEPLNVYVYKGFVSPYGAGISLKEAFEHKHRTCSLKYVFHETGPAILQRLAFEGSQTKAHLLLNIDTTLYEKISGYATTAYGYTVPALIYDKRVISNPPRSWDELLSSPHEIILEDPRSSAPGRALILWGNLTYGKDMWQKLKAKTRIMTKGWTEAFSLFQQEEAPIMMSYAVDQAYSILKKKKDHIGIIPLKEGHLRLAEYAVQVRPHPCSQAFIDFLLSDTGQSLLQEKSWMIPLKTSWPSSWPPLHLSYIPLKAPPIYPLDIWIKEWEQAWFQ